MTTKTTKQPTVTVRIEPGKPTPAQRESWRRFWQKLTMAAKSEGENDRSDLVQDLLR